MQKRVQTYFLRLMVMAFKPLSLKLWSFLLSFLLSLSSCLMTYCKRSGLLISPFTNLKLGFLTRLNHHSSSHHSPTKQEKKRARWECKMPWWKGITHKTWSTQKNSPFCWWTLPLRDLDAQLPYHRLKILGVRAVVQAIQNHNPQLNTKWSWCFQQRSWHTYPVKMTMHFGMWQREFEACTAVRM